MSTVYMYIAGAIYPDRSQGLAYTFFLCVSLFSEKKNKLKRSSCIITFDAMYYLQSQHKRCCTMSHESIEDILSNQQQIRDMSKIQYANETASF